MRCRKEALWCLMTVVLLMGGCTGKKVVMVDEAGFCEMGRRIGPVLKSHEILDEDGGYVTSLTGSGTAPANAGAKLFEHLCPAFRYPGMDPAALPATFAASKGPGDALTIRPAGFALVQGTKTINVSLLSMADWNDDGRNDWFVQCEVSSKRPEELRVYYLVIENPDDEVIRPRLMGVYECRAGRCNTITGAQLRQNQGFTPESMIVDIMPGQQAITAPPSAPLVASPPVRMRRR